MYSLFQHKKQPNRLHVQQSMVNVDMESTEPAIVVITNHALTARLHSTHGMCLNLRTIDLIINFPFITMQATLEADAPPETVAIEEEVQTSMNDTGIRPAQKAHALKRKYRWVLRAAQHMQATCSDMTITSPDGESIRVPAELFEASFQYCNHPSSGLTFLDGISYMSREQIRMLVDQYHAMNGGDRSHYYY